MAEITTNRFCQQINGVNIPCFFSKDCFLSALHYKPKPGDVFIVTYPKCGTTWMQNLVLNILRESKPLKKPLDWFLASPFLDQLGAEDSENRMIHPGAFKTHLPFSKVPWSSEAKYIYVTRNIKDCSISFYNHMKQIPGYQFSEGTFDEFLEYFMNGNLEFGNYFDHLIPWYNARNAPNVFFTTYEEMKTDLRKVALDVAEFLKEGQSKFLEENPIILNSILHNCSFIEMKQFMNDALSSLYNLETVHTLENLPKGRKHIIAYIASLPKMHTKRLNFVRRGEVNAWKQDLTSNQNLTINRMISDKTKCSDVLNLWPDLI